MLILTRIPGKVIRIGDDIRIRILDINGNQIRIGIEAPDHIPVYREELYLRIKNEQGSLLQWQKNE